MTLVEPEKLPSFIQSINEAVAVINRAIEARLINPQTFDAAKNKAVISTGILNPISIGEAVQKILEAKRNANRSPRYIKSLSHFLRQFSRGRENTMLAAFEVGDIEQFIAPYKCAYTRQTWINRLSTLFSFAVRRGWIDRNPCDRIERVTIDRQPPKILTPAQVDEILKATPLNLRPYFILATFAGIRPEEVMRLDWPAVDMATKTVTVSFGKTRRRRIVPLEPRAVQLLQPLVKKEGPVTPSHMTIVRWRYKIRVAVLKLDRFPSDLLRHTAASMMMALIKDAGKVAARLGNSASILLTHYHQPVTEADCKAFWGI